MNTFIFDLDGVIYRDRERVPFAAKRLPRFEQPVTAFCSLLTTRQDFARNSERIADVGGAGTAGGHRDLGVGYREIPACPGYSASDSPVVGSEALKMELEAVGIRVFDAGVDVDTQPDVVVAGLDCHFTYEKLARAQQAVLRGATLVATNRDHSFRRKWPHLAGRRLHSCRD